MQLRNRKRYEDLTMVFSLNESMDQLAVVNSVCWIWSYVEKRGWSCLKKGTRF